MLQQTALFRYVPPSWAAGHITFSDAAFLASFVGEFGPPAVVEVGVASGCSSAVLLQALAAVHGKTMPPATRLFSFDVADRCYFDPAHAVGEAVDEMAPELRASWSLNVGDALDARRMLTGCELSLGFIDADHRHPWPTVDLLAILPTLRPGAWVVLHDIRLAELGSGPMYDNHGAQYLFDAWPWAKRSDGNIGAIRLDGSPDEILALCARLFDVRWEASIPHATMVAIGQQRGDAAIDDDRSPADRAILHLKRTLTTSRQLVVWGAGRAGQDFLVRLRDARVTVAGIVDGDERKVGHILEGVEISLPATLQARVAERPFVAVCSVCAEEIARDLDARGFVAGFDYLIV